MAFSESMFLNLSTFSSRSFASFSFSMFRFSFGVGVGFDGVFVGKHPTFNQ
ncbi:hypothetical protein MNB_SV-12-495 [hydrothermal vent metagenome]|uniref:Uncharacterized protein n=1 Tax=hydrothermal vent metagenome TaxID=652676 RepID=A0A1W1CNL9_9ZZZZ